VKHPHESKGIYFMEKTKVKLIGTDGNIFMLLGAASRALQRDKKDPTEMQHRAVAAVSYGEALRIIYEYVEEEE
jgi:hypothetical protein